MVYVPRQGTRGRADLATPDLRGVRPPRVPQLPHPRGTDPPEPEGEPRGHVCRPRGRLRRTRPARRSPVPARDARREHAAVRRHRDARPAVRHRVAGRGRRRRGGAPPRDRRDRTAEDERARREAPCPSAPRGAVAVDARPTPPGALAVGPSAPTRPTFTAADASKAVDLLAAARTAATAGRHGAVLALEADAARLPVRADPAAWKSLVATATAGCERTLASAVDAARAQRCDEAARILATLRQTSASGAVAVEAERGERAVDLAKRLATTPAAERARGRDRPQDLRRHAVGRALRVAFDLAVRGARGARGRPTSRAPFAFRLPPRRGPPPTASPFAVPRDATETFPAARLKARGRGTDLRRGEVRSSPRARPTRASIVGRQGDTPLPAVARPPWRGGRP